MTTHQEVRSRRSIVLGWRREGLLFREIGARLGVTKSRAGAIVHQAEREAYQILRGLEARPLACIDPPLFAPALYDVWIAYELGAPNRDWFRPSGTFLKGGPCC